MFWKIYQKTHTETKKKKKNGLKINSITCGSPHTKGDKKNRNFENLNKKNPPQTKCFKMLEDFKNKQENKTWKLKLKLQLHYSSTAALCIGISKTVLALCVYDVF